MEAPLCPICLDDNFIPNILLKSGKFKYECQCECHKKEPQWADSSQLVRKDLLLD